MSLAAAEWKMSDALVLQSIYMSATKKGATLRDIISCGDYIDRSIFTYEEMYNALAKLISNKVIIHSKKGPETSKEFKTLYEKGKISRDVAKETRKSFTILQDKFPLGTIIALDEAILNKSSFEKAVQKYLQS